ncbi:hypothetical protein EAM_1545 [Erwinia amylovora ATCC 49946]|nr:hypothetical protein EAM_1545 [Erwinia amylovora ATCC 49946]
MAALLLVRKNTERGKLTPCAPFKCAFRLSERVTIQTADVVHVPDFFCTYDHVDKLPSETNHAGISSGKLVRKRAFWQLRTFRQLPEVAPDLRFGSLP